LVPGLTEQLETGIDVADIACGSGHAINVMARAFPQSRFTGYDFSDEGLAAARAEAAAWGLTNAQFVAQDVATLDARDAYDLITIFDAIHDQAQPRRVLKNMATALRSGGTLLAVDVAASSNLEENLDHPLAPAMYAISTTHCMTVSLALGGEGLGTMWGEQQARELLTAAGFTVQEVKYVEGDILNAYYLCTKA
jgi:ubiquinone/menaquinone biosynthesis C-methylase UbiE